MYKWRNKDFYKKIYVLSLFAYFLDLKYGKLLVKIESLCCFNLNTVGCNTIILFNNAFFAIVALERYFSKLRKNITEKGCC